MKTAAWRAGYRAANGFGQFYRDWQPSEEHCPPIAALHGSLTQSGMWVAMGIPAVIWAAGARLLSSAYCWQHFCRKKFYRSCDLCVGEADDIDLAQQPIVSK